MMSHPLETFQQTFAVIIDMPVQWGEMDAFQHVNNVSYFRYFESVRIAYLSRTSLFDAAGAKGSGEKAHVFPLLAATECRYKYAVNFPDTLKLGCSLAECQEHGFLQSYGIYSSAQDCVTTLGSGRVVLLDTETRQKTLLSAKLKAEMEAIEAERK